MSHQNTDFPFAEIKVRLLLSSCNNPIPTTSLSWRQPRADAPFLSLHETRRRRGRRKQGPQSQTACLSHSCQVVLTGFLTLSLWLANKALLEMRNIGLLFDKRKKKIIMASLPCSFSCFCSYLIHM